MTTLAVAHVPGFIFVLSDRRLTNPRTQAPDLNSNATKSVLFHKTMVLAYTGVAEIWRGGRRLDPLNEWIAEQIQTSSSPIEAIDTLTNSLNEHFQRMRMNPRSHPLSIVGGGWASDGTTRFPVWIRVSNRSGKFTASISNDAAEMGSLRLNSYGIPFDHQALLELRTQERHLRRRNSSDARDHLRALISIFQRFAGRTSDRVSRDVLVTILPEPNGASGIFSVTLGSPNPARPTYLYVPAGRSTGRATLFAPTAVLPGLVVLDMRVTYGR